MVTFGINRASLSAVIPTCGRINYLRQCIKSLISQSVLPEEIVIIDNSQDGRIRKKIRYLLNHLEAEIFQKLDIKIIYVSEKRKDIASTRNRGVKTAKYDLIAWIDDDCVADKNWIKNIISIIKNSPKFIIQGKNLNGNPGNIFSCVEYFTDAKFFRGSFYRNEQGRAISKFLDAKNFAFNRTIIGRALFFDPKFCHMYEDVDFGLRMRKKGILTLYNPQIVVKHFGRNNLIDHLKREFSKGRGHFQFISKWRRTYSATHIRKEISHLVNKILMNKSKIVGLREKRQILKSKGLIFRLCFDLIIFLDKIPFYLGYLWEKIIHLDNTIG